ncbi:hypothetical protein [Marilutibacter chinensis]|uniref:Uncharacterized protein n=1 Tax=Marilutibacter chinensis TaxID=2912247 RepID=A0ABS9HWE1_9GAMM|nr:hypothetical protein [Lysobacter chinensis]MCF7223210.1 hypothetical protein [Lysobacter chinensis]
MTRHDHEPLTPEERALADRLARLAVRDGPPPALDAKILAAAHEAVARTPRRGRRRWLGLSGGAGGLVTGLGLAASLTLVLGVVWQLRPGDSVLPQVGEGPAGEAEHVILVDELPSSEPRTRIVEPPPTARESAPAAAPIPSSAPSALPVTDDAAGTRSRAGHASREADMESKREAAGQEAREQASEETTQARPAMAPAPAPRPEDAATPAPTAFPVTGQVSPEPAGAPRRATYTRAARAEPERAAKLHAEEARTETQSALQEAPAAYAAPAPAIVSDTAELPPDAADSAAAASTADTEAESVALDRVEVTGSRIRSAGVAAIPVHEDRSLAPRDWLERIRARRAAGDADAARESLRLFRKAHPRVRLPDDLHELLAAPEGDGPDAP